MDLFIYNDTYWVWICRPCGYAVLVPYLQTHLATQHGKHPSAATPALQVAAQALMGRQPAWDLTQGACVPPPPESAPVPGLPVYQGYRCPHCPYVARALSNLLKHQRRAHPEAPRPRPGWPLAPELGLPEPLAISCQWFFPARAGSSFFQVTPPAQVERMKQAATMTAPEFIQA